MATAHSPQAKQAQASAEAQGHALEAKLSTMTHRLADTQMVPSSSMVGVVPSMVGVVPSMVGLVPSMVGVVPSIVRVSP